MPGVPSFRITSSPRCLFFRKKAIASRVYCRAVRPFPCLPKRRFCFFNRLKDRRNDSGISGGAGADVLHLWCPINVFMALSKLCAAVVDEEAVACDAVNVVVLNLEIVNAVFAGNALDARDGDVPAEVTQMVVHLELTSRNEFAALEGVDGVILRHAQRLAEAGDVET